MGLKGQRVVAFAGIGRPAKFFATLRALGCAEIAEQQGFADHYRYTELDLHTLDALAQANNAMLVTTEKDWARLPLPWRATRSTR